MKTFALCSVVSAGLLFASAAGAASDTPRPLPWLVAQADKTCEMDGQQMRLGTVVCHEKKTWTCTATGWSVTGQKCVSTLPKKK
jgi:hypothetical protein